MLPSPDRKEPQHLDSPLILGDRTHCPSKDRKPLRKKRVVLLFISGFGSLRVESISRSGSVMVRGGGGGNVSILILTPKT